MAIQRGTLAVAWSLATTAASAVAGQLGTGTVQSVDFAEEADEKEIKGADGDVKAVIFSNARETCTLEIIPSGATLAAAKTANVIPAVGQTITITDADDAEVASTTALWICTGASKRKSIDGESVITVNCRRYAVNLPEIST